MKIRRFLLPLLVLAGFAVLAYWNVASAPEPEPEPREDLGALVEVEAVYRTAQRLDVEAQGTVLPARQVTVQPQVGGRVVWVSPDLVPGGRFRTGQHLFRVEASDYELALATAESMLQEAEAQLALERGRGRVAEREWELFRDELDEEQRASTLALREPQLRAAEAAVASARARVQQAELDLERTTVRSPFNALVRSENVEIGQTISPQSQIATLVGTDRFWVQASVPTDRVGAIAVPDEGADKASRVVLRGASVEEGASSGASEGRVARLLGDVDPAGRMARVLVEIPNPLANENPARRLLLDSFVDLVIEGAEERSLFALPREWLQDGRDLWLFEDGRLEVRPVEVVWTTAELVFVDEGLEDGDEVVTSRIATPVPGMRLRRLGNAESSPSREGSRMPISTTAHPVGDPDPSALAADEADEESAS